MADPQPPVDLEVLLPVHNEAESIQPEEAEAGCQVLFEAVLARANRTLSGGS